MKQSIPLLLLLLFSFVVAVQYTWLAGSSNTVANGGGCDSAADGDGPSARRLTQLRRCPGRPNALYLVSGQSDDVCGDVWMFSLLTLSWTRLIDHADSPFYRVGPASWCDLSDQIWLYGGEDEFETLRSDMWRFNTSTNDWSLIMTESSLRTTDPPHPGERKYILHDVDSKGNLIMFSGNDECDLWMFNVLNEQWEILHIDYNSANYDVVEPPGLPINGILAVTDDIITIGFGYFLNTRQFYGSLWEFDITTKTWERVFSTTSRSLPTEFGVFDTANSPGPLVGALYWSYDSNIYVAMGRDKTRDHVFNDVWIWNVSLRQWAWLAGSGIFDDPGEYNGISHSGMPAARSYTWFADDPEKDLPLTFFFGGWDENWDLHSDLWLIDLDDGKRCQKNEFYYLGSTTCHSCENGTYSHGNTTTCLQCDMLTSPTLCLCSMWSYWNGSECIECDDDSQLNQNHDGCISISALITVKTIGISVSVVTVTTTSVATIVTLLSTSYDATSTLGSDSSASTGQFCALMGMINEWQSGLSLAFSSGFAWMMGLFEYPFIRISESEFSASSSLERFLQFCGISVESMFRVVVTSYFIIVAIDTFIFGFYGLVVKFYTDKSLKSTGRNFLKSLAHIWTFMFYPITIASMLELRNVSQTETGRQLSSIFALGIGSLMFFPFLLFGYEKEKRRRHGAENFYTSVLKTFYAPYADDRLYYVFIPLSLRLLKSLCIVFLSGIGQVLSLTLIYCLILCLVFIANPYHSKFTKYKNVLCLIVYVGVCLIQCTSAFLSSESHFMSVIKIILQTVLLLTVVASKVRSLIKLRKKSQQEPAGTPKQYE